MVSLTNGQASTAALVVGNCGAGCGAGCEDAPIAPAFHPCNRSDLHACKACGKLFLRYTEGGGYYVDARVRELDPDLIAP